jgi:hypothetical protein
VSERERSSTADGRRCLSDSIATKKESAANCDQKDQKKHRNQFTVNPVAEDVLVFTLPVGRWISRRLSVLISAKSWPNLNTHVLNPSKLDGSTMDSILHEEIY